MIGSADFLGTGWKYPMSVVAGRLALAVGEVDIKESIWLILSTRKRERVMRPDFGCGLNELVFAPNNENTMSLAAYYVRESLQEWEPRIEVVDVQVLPDVNNAARMNVTITYTVLSTNSDENLVYPFYLQNA